MSAVGGIANQNLFPAGPPVTSKQGFAYEGALRLSDAQREAAILELLPDVRGIAGGIHRRLPQTVQVDDLIQAGSIGLIDAASRFNPEKKLPFRQYARIRITGAIFDSLREMDWASRYMRTRQQKLEQTTRDLETKLGRRASQEEVADELGLDLQGFYEFAATVQDLHRVETESDGEEEETRAFVENVAANEDDRPDMQCFRREKIATVRQALSKLSADEQKVVAMYYFAEKTMAEIAEQMRRTESRISQIHSRALQKLGSALGGVLGRKRSPNQKFQRTRNRRDTDTSVPELRIN